MRCLACDRELTDLEATRKSSTTGLFLDLCNSCLYWVADDLNTTENFGLYDSEHDDLDSIIERETDAIPESSSTEDD